jgi:hypothetical protein
MRPGGAWPAFSLAVGVLAVVCVAGYTIAADPGSKDDPLATVSYVNSHAQFTRHELASGQSLRLGTGTEMVITSPAYQEIKVDGLDGLRDDLINLTTGEQVGNGILTAYHHYINASNHDVFIKPGCDVILLVRGEWK